MASCAASRRPRRRLASSSELEASPKMILSPSCVVMVTNALFGTHPVMVLPSDSGSSSSEFLRGSRMMASTCVQSRLASMMTSSCPRLASPSFAVSELGETRMVSSWMSVPRCACARARPVEKVSVKPRIKRKIACSQNRKLGAEVGTPPPPRSIGIIELAENREKILELQAVAGKILSAKDLRSLCGSFIIFFGVLH